MLEYNIASRIRTWNCAGPRKPSKLVPEALDGVRSAQCFVEISSPLSTWVIEGVRSREGGGVSIGVGVGVGPAAVD
eukprot:11894784-Alexandrium_andersonii.AAC.1